LLEIGGRWTHGAWCGRGDVRGHHVKKIDRWWWSEMDKVGWWGIVGVRRQFHGFDPLSRSEGRVEKGGTERIVSRPESPAGNSKEELPGREAGRAGETTPSLFVRPVRHSRRHHERHERKIFIYTFIYLYIYIYL